MVGRFQPYLYNAPVDTSSFNPKAVTMASRLPPPPRKKQNGPLVDFNQHPDSYLMLPYGNIKAKPMHKRTKAFVKVARSMQLFCRLCTLLGAVGVLLCGIFIRGTGDTEGYVMRIPPGADIVVCLYAIYHLIRNAKSRPPGSSASYHFFALVTDAGFIPFYVFTVLMSRRNSDLAAGTSGRWRTMFPTDEETNKVLRTTWLTATTVAALHLLSSFLDLYLLVVFRNISKMPPDMNPLEDNLTSRRKSKHKHKNSSLSAITPLTGDNEKRFSAQSTIAGDRLSQVDPLISKDVPAVGQNQMAFMHTRTQSTTTYSPHTPQSARESRERFSMYSQPPSAYQSRRELNHRDDLLRREVDDEETLSQRKIMLAQQANIKRHSRAGSFVTKSSKEQFFTPPGTANTDRQEATGDLSLQRNSRESLQNDNWFVYANQYDGVEQEEHYPVPAAVPAAVHVRKEPALASHNTSSKGYSSLASYDDVSDMEDEQEELEKPMMPQPLRMNPPTPPPAQAIHRAENRPSPGPNPTQVMESPSSMDATPSGPDSPSRSDAPKPKYYGDLKAATQAIRNGNPPAGSPNTSPSKGSFRKQPNHLPSATKQYVSNTPPPSSHSTGKNSPFTLDKKMYTSVRRTGETGHTPVKSESPRVVSRSGVDYMKPYELDDSDLGTAGRRRDVSGKIAEEGRGGLSKGGWGGMTFRKISGAA